MFQVCCVFLRLILVITIVAHSQRARLIKRLAYPLTNSLEVLPRSNSVHARNEHTTSRTLFHDDNFRLTISAFDETFHLHLRPNDHLIHPAARVTYYTTAPDGSVQKQTSPLLRETVKAYWGEVIAAHHSPTRMREDAARIVRGPHPAELGFARIVVHDEGNSDLGIAPEYEGAFSVHGEIYHITTKDNYLIRKRPLDALPVEQGDMDTRLVIWRESDVMTPAEEHSIGLDSNPVGQMCGYGRLSYNGPGENPVLQKSFQSSPGWVDPLWAILGDNELYARDDVATGGTGMNTKYVRELQTFHYFDNFISFVNNIGDSTGCPTSQKVVSPGDVLNYELFTPDRSTWELPQTASTSQNTERKMMHARQFLQIGTPPVPFIRFVLSPTCNAD